MTLRSGFILGSWTIYPLEGRLDNGEEERRIQPKTMDVLLCLADAAGAVVERESLLTAVWGERAPSDEPLTRCIGELRRALGDTRTEPEYILTVPKRGYRLLQPGVAISEPSQAEDESDVLPITPAQKALRLVTLKKVGVGLGLLVAAAVVQIGVERVMDNRATDDQPQSSVQSSLSRSVAVLPFIDMTAAQDQAYFGDGLAEELLNLLAQNPALRVAARTSSFSFRDNAVPIGEIASQLGVKHVLEGSVRRDGDRIRVIAQLISADDGYHIWSESYDEPFGDIFSIQDRISAQIAAALEVSVLGDQARAPQTDPETYALFLQAKHRARQGSREAMEQAVAFFKEALSIDSGYAPAWAHLANVYNNLAGQGHWDRDEGFLAARDAALRAIDVGPEYSGGYQQMAWIAHRYDGDLGAAMQHMQRALQINSADVEILRNAAVLLLQIGRLEEAIRVLEYCAARSPMDPRGFYNLGVAYKYADRLEDAEHSFRKIMQMSPEYNGAKYNLAETLLLMGRPEEALILWQQLQEHRPAMGTALVMYALQRQEESDAALAELVAGWGEQWPDTVADIHAYRGEIDEAFAWLEKDYEKYGAAGWGEMKLQRWFDTLRGDPRWTAILERAGVSDDQLSLYDLDVAIPST